MKNFFKSSLLFLLILTFKDVSYAQLPSHPHPGEWNLVETSNNPIQRHENGAVAYGGKVYLIGGRGNNPVNIYDPQSNSWTSVSGAGLEMHHFQAVVYNDKIYVMGAFNGGWGNEVPIPNVWIFDPKTNEWTQGPEIPSDRRRASAGVVVYNNKIYMVSGIINGHFSGHVPWLDEFDPNTGNWKKLADAPRARDHFHAAVHNGKIYAIGGRNSHEHDVFGDTRPEIDVYDINSGNWSTLDKTLPTPRAGNTAIVLDNDLLVIGGESMTQDNAHSETEALNLSDYSWTKMADMKIGRHGTQAVMIGNKIFMPSGSTQRGAAETPTLEVFQNNAPYEANATELHFMNGPNDFKMILENDQMSMIESGISELHIRADVAPAQVGSVVFEVNGQSYIDNQPPYVLGHYPWDVGTYQVKATPFSLPNGEGNSGGSVTRTFTISEAVTGLQNHLASEFKFKAFPNPFSNKINFEFITTNSDDISFAIYDIRGAKIKEVFTGKGSPGKKINLTYEDSGLHSGMYFARLQIGQKILNYKILLNN
jgi:N-acetylneuraminic acid mutarotase